MQAGTLSAHSLKAADCDHLLPPPLTAAHLVWLHSDCCWPRSTQEICLGQGPCPIQGVCPHSVPKAGTQLGQR